MTAQENGDELKLGLLYNMLGNVAKEENNFTAALEHYIRATEIFEKCDNKDGANTKFVQYRQHTIFLREL